MQKLLAQKQEAEEILNGLDEEKAKLEEQLYTIRQKCAEEASLVGFWQLSYKRTCFLQHFMQRLHVLDLEKRIAGMKMCG